MYTILICDDDRDIVSALDIYLTSEGYQTVKAYDGQEAIRAAETHEVHLILMDIMMPELDGIRACRQTQRRAVQDHGERHGHHHSDQGREHRLRGSQRHMDVPCQPEAGGGDCDSRR